MDASKIFKILDTKMATTKMAINAQKFKWPVYFTERFSQLA